MLAAGAPWHPLGDFAAFQLRLGLPEASLALSTLSAVLIGLMTGRFAALSLFSWAPVFAILAASTAAGDLFAHTFGPSQSMLVFATLPMLLVAMWNQPPQATRSVLPTTP